jgi:excinuclease ABC subunit C
MVQTIHPSVLTELRKTGREAPLGPGVYLWKDEDGKIIYVGKARSLRSRLSSYFSGEKDIKTATLIRHARTIETIITNTEYEALLLENTLIKQHSPRYNINLKDGKSYPVIRITSEDYPRIFRTRHIVEDGSRYYGPFPNVQAVDTMLDLVERLFPLRKCRSSWKSKSGALKKRQEPCMYYHIGRCLAPCCGRITAEEYQGHVKRVEQLLTGDTETLLADLKEKMRQAAGELKFERAAQLRNAIRAIEDLSGGESSVVDFDPEGRDYIAWAAEGLFTSFTVFSLRSGKMTGRDLYRTKSAAEENESLENFITAYYNPSRLPPGKIYLQASVLSPQSSLPSWFQNQFGYEPNLLPPADRHHEAVMAMAHQNAEEDLRRRMKERGAGPALDELQQALQLENRPEKIEGFDIAQLDGKHPVASLISFKDGIPDKKNYRYFKLRTVVGIVDDFAAMREAVHRRYSRLIREGKELPDLVLIDGGIGQVNAAKGVMDELGMDSDVAGLAKREEELWLPGAKEPVILSRRSEALKILQHVRDETHRFATGLNQRLRSGDLFFPVLESVEGIGPKRAAAIMKAFGSVTAIAAAEAGNIAERCRISADAAKAVRAAAKLALEDQEKAREKLAGGPARRGRQGGVQKPLSSGGAEELAALAAEEKPEYSTG